VLRGLVISQVNFKNQELTIRVFEPVLTIIRLMDNKHGATLSILYNLCLQVDVLLRNPIQGLDDDVREKMHRIFMGKWTYLHENVHVASAVLHPEFIRRQYDDSEMSQFKYVLKQMATVEHTYVKMVSQYGRLRTAMSSGANDFTDDAAFSSIAMSSPAFEWCTTWLSDYPDLQWAAIRLVSIKTGSCACEHSFGVEAWIHSKKRNRLGQLNVQRLLRAHTNLIIEESLSRPDGVRSLAWDIELIIEDPEPESEEEDQ
jgi:hAT family C-terminal dimerisation region